MSSPRGSKHARKQSSQGIGQIEWHAEQLNRLFAVARQAAGETEGIPYGHWWPALLALMLDTAVYARDILQLRRDDFDSVRGVISIGLFVYVLHGEAARRVRTVFDRGRGSRLFPWTRDTDLLSEDFKELVALAEGPVILNRKPLDAVRLTGRLHPDMLDRIDFEFSFEPRETPLAPKKVKGQHKPSSPGLLRITLPDNLCQFFDSIYVPQRLADSSHETVMMYRKPLDEFSRWLACDATFANLTDDSIEQFLAWLKASGRLGNPTINKYRAELLAVWNHAWRKGKVSAPVRDVGRLREVERVPEAWSTDQVQQILDAARSVSGTIGAVPARVWWPAIVLTLYDTGLRIDALMRATSIDLNRDSRWLTVRAETQKQKADQVFRLHPETMTAIALVDAAVSPHRDRLFPTNLQSPRNHLGDCYRQILLNAGLSAGRRDLFHKMRRTSATAVTRSLGIDAAQKHLGHSSVSVTRRYIDPRLVGPTQLTAADAIERPERREASRAS